MDVKYYWDSNLCSESYSINYFIRNDWVQTHLEIQTWNSKLIIII